MIANSADIVASQCGISSGSSVFEVSFYGTEVNSNTDRLYTQWLNLVIYWLMNHCTEWHDIIQFMMSSITYSLVMLTIDGVMSVSQQMDIQSVHKNKGFSPNKSYGKF